MPFSYLISPTKAVGFSVDLTEAIADEVRRQTKKPQLALSWLDDVLPYGLRANAEDPASMEVLGEPLYKRWFEPPIPPAGAVTAMPMGPALRENLRVRSDKPAN